MNPIATYLKEAEAGHIVRLSDVTKAFERDADAVPVTLTLCLFDGGSRSFCLRMPRWQGEEERAFLKEYALMRIGNILSALGGRSLTIGVPAGEPEMMALFSEAERVLRSGDGHSKPLRVIGRIQRNAGREPFTIAVTEGAILPEENPEATEKDAASKGKVSLSERLRNTAARAEKGTRMGIDIGGTDIKAVVYQDGALVAVKEFDWDPGRSPDAEGIIAPIVQIARLLRCAAALWAEPHPALSAILNETLGKDAPPEKMAHAIRQIEEACTPGAGLSDSIGISFPDVVLKDRISGGETPKTCGIKKAQPENYEREFAELSRLNERLATVLKPGGTIRMANDGNIAAYTAAVELAHGEHPEFVEKGVLAHSLGTDLGTGYLMTDGSFPDAPLECYDFRFDLGSRPQRAYPPQDLRSMRNENTGLWGAARYLGQAAVFRLMWARAPERIRAFVQESEGFPKVRTEPEDLRKPLLAHIMALADAGDPDAEAVFREIGENLGEISHEIDSIFMPETRARLIFGRVVKSSRCFALIKEGCSKTYPQLTLAAADGALANTSLMRALACREDVTVAQFGQGAGAAVFGAEGSG